MQGFRNKAAAAAAAAAARARAAALVAAGATWPKISALYV
jgi:hypothetical protein